MREGQRSGPGLVLGIDIGATKVVLALGRADGTIVAETRVAPWPNGAWPRDLAAIAAGAERLRREAGAANEALRAIGIAAAGPLDPLRGVIRFAPNLPGWRDVPIVAELSRALGAPARLENDANAAAFAEWRFGAGRGSRAFVFLTMSTGVGAGFVFDGCIYSGARGQAGELGHIPIEAGGRTCACGLSGCLEAYTGGAALAAQIREALAGGATSEILSLAGGDPARIRAEHWVEALRAGDVYALRLREEFLDRLAQGLAIAIIALDPDCVALGTIVARNPDLFLEPLRARVEARIWANLRDTKLVCGELGARLPAYAGLVSAVAPDGS